MWAPRLANACAIARPTPPDAPVTTTTSAVRGCRCSGRSSHASLPESPHPTPAARPTRRSFDRRSASGPAAVGAPRLLMAAAGAHRTPAPAAAGVDEQPSAVGPRAAADPRQPLGPWSRATASAATANLTARGSTAGHDHDQPSSPGASAPARTHRGVGPADRFEIVSARRSPPGDRRTPGRPRLGGAGFAQFAGGGRGGAGSPSARPRSQAVAGAENVTGLRLPGLVVGPLVHRVGVLQAQRSAVQRRVRGGPRRLTG